jgi:hypothetical protein
MHAIQILAVLLSTFVTLFTVTVSNAKSVCMTLTASMEAVVPNVVDDAA